MKFLLLLIVIFLVTSPAFAYKVYTYDRYGNRVYYRIPVSEYSKNKSKKFSHIYETHGPRPMRYYTRSDRERYYARLR